MHCALEENAPFMFTNAVIVIILVTPQIKSKYQKMVCSNTSKCNNNRDNDDDNYYYYYIIYIFSIYTQLYINNK